MKRIELKYDAGIPKAPCVLGKTGYDSYRELGPINEPPKSICLIEISEATQKQNNAVYLEELGYTMLDANHKTYSHASATCSRILLAFAVSMLTLISGTPLEAQEAPPSKVIPINAKFRDVSTENLSGDARTKARSRNTQARKARNVARDAARDGISSGNMAPVKEYFNGYVFPQMTQPEQLKESGTLRDTFFRTFLKSDVNENSRKKLISEVILPAMKAIATGKDYSPSARLNAVALVGRLDESALVKNGTRVRPPRPSLAAFQFLSRQLNDASAPAWLKAAAVQGLVRHLQVDRAVNGQLLNAGQRDLLETFANNTLEGKNAGQADWSKDVDYWLKRRSVQLLGAIGRAGAGGRVIDRLVSIAGDEKQTEWMQLDAVKSLRAINFAGASEAQVSKVMVTVVEFLQRQLANQEKAIGTQVDELIYKNILYGDTDFVVSGTRYSKNIAKPARGGMGMMGMGMDDEMDRMGMEGSMGRGMGGSMGRGMGGSGKKMEEPVFLVELPNYQMNLIRRRMKIFAFSANDVLQSANGLEAAASAKDKQLRLAINKFTNTFLKDSNIGLVDVSKEDDFEDEEMEMQKVSYTEQLQEVCKEGASKLKTILTRHAGDGGLGDAPGGEAKPAGGGSLPF